MAVKIGDVTIRIGASTKELEADLRKAERALQSSAAKFQTIGQNLTLGVTVPVLAAGAAAFKMASDYEESLNKVRVAFGASSDSVEEFAKTTLDMYGIAEGTALDMAALFGDMATAMGLPQSEAATLSQSLVGLAGDLASFKNVALSEVQTALAGVFTGETESLKRLGFVLTEQNLQEFAVSEGITKKVNTMKQAEKVTLRYNYLIKAASNALGDFARTSDGAANQSRSLGEQLKELGAQMGQILLPVVTKIIKSIREVITRFQNLSQSQKEFIVVMAGTAAAIGPVFFAMGKLIEIYKILAIANVRILVVLQKVTAAFIANGAAGSLAAIGWQKALLAAGPYLIAIGAILAIGYKLYQSIKEQREEKEKTVDLDKQAIKDTENQRNKVIGLVGVLKSEVATKQQKKKALTELKQINNEYFGQLDAEKSGVDKINIAYQEWVKNLISVSKAKAAREEIDKLTKKLLEIEEQEFQGIQLEAVDAEKVKQNLEGLSAGQLEQQQKINQGFKGIVKEYTKGEKEAIQARIDFLSKFAAAAAPGGGGGGGGDGIGDELKKDLAKIALEIANVDKLFKAGLITGSEASESKLKLLQERLNLLVINGFQPTSQAVVDTKNSIKELQNELGLQFINVDVLDEFSKKFANLDKQIQAGTITSFQATSEKVQLLTDEMQRLKDEGVAPTSEEFKRLTKIYDNLAQETDGVVKNIGALITKVKDVSDPIAELGNTILSDVSKQITIIQDKAKLGLISATDADIEKINTLESAISDLVDQGFGDSDIAKKLQEQLKGIDKPVSDIFEFLGKKFENIFNVPPGKGKEIAEGIATSIGTALSVVSQLNANREAELDNYYQKEKERIETSIGSEESKAAQIKALDESVAKKKSALARKQAAIDKAAAIFSATINAATAVVKALPNPILAGIVAALAAAQIAAIAAAPLPSLAIGTDMVKSDGLAMIHKGEAIVPADVAKGGYSGGGGIANVVGRIQGTDIILASDYSMNFKNRIR